MFSKLVLQRHWLTKTSLGHLNQRWWSIEFCSPLHVSAWGCIISLRRGGSCREQTRRCVTLALPPRRAAHFRCCVQTFLGTADSLPIPQKSGPQSVPPGKPPPPTRCLRPYIMVRPCSMQVERIWSQFVLQLGAAQKMEPMHRRRHRQQLQSSSALVSVS